MIAQKTISIGSTVQISMANGKAFTITIKSSAEANPTEYVVSYESPIGQALLGKHEGETFSYSVESRVMTGRITGIL